MKTGIHLTVLGFMNMSAHAHMNQSSTGTATVKLTNATVKPIGNIDDEYDEHQE